MGNFMLIFPQILLALRLGPPEPSCWVIVPTSAVPVPRAGQLHQAVRLTLHQNNQRRVFNLFYGKLI